MTSQPPRADYQSFFGAEDLCLQCSLDEIRGLLHDVEDGEIATLRGRVEKAIRRNPAIAKYAIAVVITREWIKYGDVLMLDTE